METAFFETPKESKPSTDTKESKPSTDTKESKPSTDTKESQLPSDVVVVKGSFTTISTSSACACLFSGSPSEFMVESNDEINLDVEGQTLEFSGKPSVFIGGNNGSYQRIVGDVITFSGGSFSIGNGGFFVGGKKKTGTKTSKKFKIINTSKICDLDFSGASVINFGFGFDSVHIDSSGGSVINFGNILTPSINITVSGGSVVKGMYASSKLHINASGASIVHCATKSSCDYYGKESGCAKIYRTQE